MFRIRLEGLVATVIALALFIIAAPANAVAAPWSTTGPMHVARSWPSAVLLADGDVLVAGGITSTGPTNRVEIYHPNSGTWQDAASMKFPAWGDNGEARAKKEFQEAKDMCLDRHWHYLRIEQVKKLQLAKAAAQNVDTGSKPYMSPL